MIKPLFGNNQRCGTLSTHSKCILNKSWNYLHQFVYVIIIMGGFEIQKKYKNPTGPYFCMWFYLTFFKTFCNKLVQK